MPADCEVSIGNELCGVVAIGRCTCGKAFCSSHQALGTQGAMSLDRCTACEDAARAEAARHATDVRVRLDNAVDALLASSVRRVELYTRAEGNKRSLLGASHDEQSVHHGSGWIVGQQLWSYYPPGIRSDSVRGPWLTALVDRPGFRLEDSLARVELRPSDDGYFVLDGTLGVLDSVQLVEQLEGLLAHSAAEMP